VKVRVNNPTLSLKERAIRMGDPGQLVERGDVAIDKVREVIAGVGVSAGLMSLWLAVVMHSASALLGGTVIGLVAAFAIAVVSHGQAR
jgi:hypothetical protein